MEGLHSFIIRDSSWLVELNGSPPEADWDLFMCLNLKVGFNGGAQSCCVHHIMGPQEPENGVNGFGLDLGKIESMFVVPEVPVNIFLESWRWQG